MRMPEWRRLQPVLKPTEAAAPPASVPNFECCGEWEATRGIITAHFFLTFVTMMQP
jgi:hypothetical protein